MSWRDLLRKPTCILCGQPAAGRVESERWLCSLDLVRYMRARARERLEQRTAG